MQLYMSLPEFIHNIPGNLRAKVARNVIGLENSVRLFETYGHDYGRHGTEFFFVMEDPNLLKKPGVLGVISVETHGDNRLRKIVKLGHERYSEVSVPQWLSVFPDTRKIVSGAIDPVEVALGREYLVSLQKGVDPSEDEVKVKGVEDGPLGKKIIIITKS